MTSPGEQIAVFFVEAGTLNSDQRCIARSCTLEGRTHFLTLLVRQIACLSLPQERQTPTFGHRCRKFGDQCFQILGTCDPIVERFDACVDRGVEEIRLVLEVPIERRCRDSNCSSHLSDRHVVITVLTEKLTCGRQESAAYGRGACVRPS